MHFDPGTVSRHRIGELLDIPHIQALAEANFHASGLPMTMIDAVDDTILVRAGWPGMCQKYHRVHPEAARRCVESDKYVVGRLDESGSIQYKCKNGLWHIGIPIVAERCHMATLFITQFFLDGEVVDREYFTRQGKQFGFDVDEYMAALDQLPVYSQQRITYALVFYKVMARFIVEMAEQSLKVIHAKDFAHEKEEYWALVQNVNVGVYRIAWPDRFIRVNRATARIFGYDGVEELLKQSITELYFDREDRIAILEELNAKGVVSDHVVPMKKKDGTMIWASLTAKAQFEDDGSIAWVDGVIEDITHRKKAADELRERSEKDALTMIYNRRKLSELLILEAHKAKRYRRPLSLIFFDIDLFKLTNDNFGHEVGDSVLRITAKIVSEAIRESDIFARYGGEEFVILCPETEVAGALALAEKVRSAIEQHDYPIAGRITISAGVGLFHDDDPTETAALKRADDALYLAKSGGRNSVKVSDRQ